MHKKIVANIIKIWYKWGGSLSLLHERKEDMMRKLMLFLLVSLCLLLPQAIFAQEESGISENLYDFQVLLDGKAYQFPIPLAELEAVGWKFEEEGMDTQLLGGSSFTQLHLVQKDMDGSAEMRVEIVNLEADAKPLRECFVGNVNIASPFGIGARKIELVMSKSIELLKSTYDEVLAAYGTPTDKTDYENSKYLNYNIEKYQSYSFYFDEDNVLERAVITCYTPVNAPEQGVGASGADTEMPEYLTSYVPPTELGDDVEAGIFEFEGDLYCLLAPVSAFEENGWTVSTAKQEIAPSGHGIMNAIAMERDGKTIRLNLINLSDTARPPMQCGFAGFYGTYLKSEWPEGRFSFVLPGNISVGVSKEDIRNTYGDKVSLFSEMDGYNIYKCAMPKGMWLGFHVDNATEKLIAIEFEIRT